MKKDDILDVLPEGAPWLTPQKKILRDSKRFESFIINEKEHVWNKKFLEINFENRNYECPITYDEVPHQMYTQQSCPDVLEIFINQALVLSKKLGTKVADTQVSFYTTKPAFFIPESISIGKGLSNYNREHAHIHAIWSPDQKPGPRTEGTGGGSMHVSVSHGDAVELIEKGWAEWHPFADENFPMILLYAPQNEDEIKFSLAVISASFNFLTKS